MIKLAQLRWFGHVVRMGEERYPKMAWQARTQGTHGKRPKGRLRQTWKEGIQKIWKERGIERKGVRAIARDRARWKALLNPLHLPVQEVRLSEVMFFTIYFSYFLFRLPMLLTHFSHITSVRHFRTSIPSSANPQRQVSLGNSLCVASTYISRAGR
jgi:hypothetical protein